MHRSETRASFQGIALLSAPKNAHFRNGFGALHEMVRTMLAFASGHLFFHVRLARVKEVDHGFAVVQVLGALGQLDPVARAG